MSQSPLNAFDADQLLAYRQGWKALNRLLHEDRSFSGRERHCAFLNTGGTEFANVSSVTGLDFKEDGRALGLCDWDFDGDIDLWITHRTAPRLRFLKNEGNTKNRFISFKLEGNGKSTNRDAIGARLSLHLPGEDKPRIKTVRGGDGFLTKSTNWVHFGLGDHGKVERLEVHWPGGSKSVYSQGLEVDAFYLVNQAGSCDLFVPPERAKLQPSAQPEPPKLPLASRTVVPAKVPLPSFSLKDGDGNEIPLANQLRPTLLNVWGSWCQPCLVELKAWTKHAKEFDQRGVRVVALSTDALDDSMGDPARAQELLADMGFPFEAYSATEEAVLALDLVQRAVLDRWRPLPIPASFLLDSEGKVAMIYRGAVEPETILEDLDLLDSTPEELRDAAAPFSGIWSHDPATAEPLAIAAQYLDYSLFEEALDYLKLYVDVVSDEEGEESDIYYAMATLLVEDQQNEKAADAYASSIEHNAEDYRVRFDYGKLLARMEKFDEAEIQLRKAVEIFPDDPSASRALAVLLSRQGNTEGAASVLRALADRHPSDFKLRLEAVRLIERSGKFELAIGEYKKILSEQPKAIGAAERIGRIRASHPDPNLRNGREALVLGSRLCQITGNKNGRYLDLLAMAHAEMGNFEQAIQNSRQAILLAPDSKDAINTRIQGYENERPFRDPTMEPIKTTKE